MKRINGVKHTDSLNTHMYYQEGRLQDVVPLKGGVNL